jgi:NHS family xanthosine MFS transporter
VASSALIGAFFILTNGNTDWNGAWLLFAAYSLVVAILFMLLFKEKPQAA